MITYRWKPSGLQQDCCFPCIAILNFDCDCFPSGLLVLSPILHFDRVNHGYHFRFGGAHTNAACTQRTETTNQIRKNPRRQWIMMVSVLSFDQLKLGACRDEWAVTLPGALVGSSDKIAIGDSDLINVRFRPLCGLKSDISRGPRSAKSAKLWTSGRFRIDFIRPLRRQVRAACSVR